MNLILLEADEAAALPHVVLEGARARHVRVVLGATVGTTLRVGVVDGPSGHATVTDVDDTSVALLCSLDVPPPALPPIDLLLALPRPKVLRRLWPQLSALGVGHILLTNAAKVERNYFDTHLLSPAVFRPLLIDGLQQARDTRLPHVSIHKQLKVLLEDHLPDAPDTPRLYGDPHADSTIARAVGAQHARRLLLAVGPEGGWTEYERTLLGRHRFRAVSMGSRTLRSDTACVALLALAHAALHDPGRAGAD